MDRTAYRCNFKDDTQQLGEVVVTALGLKREEKLWDMQLLK